MSTGILNNQPEPEPRRLVRRAFIVSVATAVSVGAFWGLRRTTIAAARPLAADEGPRTVTIVQFSADGKQIGTVTVPRVIKTDEEWKKQLSETSYRVTRHADTDFPSPALHGMSTVAACFAASAATWRCSAPTPIRFRHGLAELLAADRGRECGQDRGRELGDGAHRGVVPAVRCASGACVRRRASADGAALLHELGVDAVRETDLKKAAEAALSSRKAISRHLKSPCVPKLP